MDLGTLSGAEAPTLLNEFNGFDSTLYIVDTQNVGTMEQGNGIEYGSAVFCFLWRYVRLEWLRQIMKYGRISKTIVMQNPF